MNKKWTQYSNKVMKNLFKKDYWVIKIDYHLIKNKKLQKSNQVKTTWKRNKKIQKLMFNKLIFRKASKKISNQNLIWNQYRLRRRVRKHKSRFPKIQN